MPIVSDSRPARPLQQTVAATISPSVSVKGHIFGSEDLLIEGRVEGAIQLHESDVTVGRKGQVTADIWARHIQVEGEVIGDLVGDEILILKSGRVVGNATAPKVTLENGSHFRGSIDMKPRSEGQKSGRA